MKCNCLAQRGGTVDRINLWQLRTDCLRSLGKQSEASEQEGLEIGAHQEYRSPRDKMLELTFRDELYDALCIGDNEAT